MEHRAKLRIALTIDSLPVSLFTSKQAKLCHMSLILILISTNGCKRSHPSQDLYL